MRAVKIGRYGGPEVAQIVTVDDPRVGPRDVLLRVEAAAVTAGDARIRAGRFPAGFALPARLALGIRGPRRRILGGTVAGTVVAVGDHVTTLQVGDAVAGMNGAQMGAHAELLAIAADRLVPRPAGVSAEDAAGALFGGSTALDMLSRRARLRSGERILVNGASGSVGSAAVQLARTIGAHVTAVTSDRNAALAARLGADEVVDYRAVDVLSLRGFDVVLDAVGNIRRAEGLAMLSPAGRLILAVASLGETIGARGRVIAGPASERPSGFTEVLHLVADGSFDPLTTVAGDLDAIQDAYRVADSGRKIGNLVVTP